MIRLWCIVFTLLLRGGEGYDYWTAASQANWAVAPAPGLWSPHTGFKSHSLQHYLPAQTNQFQFGTPYVPPKEPIIQQTPMATDYKQIYDMQWKDKQLYDLAAKAMLESAPPPQTLPLEWNKHPEVKNLPEPTPDELAQLYKEQYENSPLNKGTPLDLNVHQQIKNIPEVNHDDIAALLKQKAKPLFESPPPPPPPYKSVPAEWEQQEQVKNIPEPIPTYQEIPPSQLAWEDSPKLTYKTLLEEISKKHQNTIEKQSSDKEMSVSPLPSREELYVDQSTWPCFYKQCRGRRQSPINIDSERIEVKPKLGPLIFHNYDKPLSDLVLTNHGYIVSVEISKEEDITVTSKWLNSTYRLFRIVFAWSNTSEYGSSHTVDGKHFPLEVLLLHLNTKYDTVVDEPDAVLSLLVFFKISKHDNYVLNAITENFNKILYPDTNTTMKITIAPVDLLPKHTDAYITYNGSSLLLPCSENYRYIIFDYANTVSEKQLKEFRKLRRIAPGEKEFELIEFGVRPIQPLNNRPIWGSVPASKQSELQPDSHKAW